MSGRETCGMFEGISLHKYSTQSIGVFSAMGVSRSDSALLTEEGKRK